MERDFRKCYITNKCNKRSEQQWVKNTTDISMSDRTTDSCDQPEGNYCEGSNLINKFSLSHDTKKILSQNIMTHNNTNNIWTKVEVL